MLSKTLRYGKGYAGKMGNKCWIAAITGSDDKYGLSRSFLDPVKVEREHFNRPRTMIDLTWRLEPGLYEASEGGDREFFTVWVKADGTYCWTRMNDERVKAMVALMDDGISADDARKATKPAKQAKGA